MAEAGVDPIAQGEPQGPAGPGPKEAFEDCPEGMVALAHAPKGLDDGEINEDEEESQGPGVMDHREKEGAPQKKQQISHPKISGNGQKPSEQETEGPKGHAQATLVQFPSVDIDERIGHQEEQ